MSQLSAPWKSFKSFSRRLEATVARIVTTIDSFARRNFARLSTLFFAGFVPWKCPRVVSRKIERTQACRSACNNGVSIFLSSCLLASKICQYCRPFYEQNEGRPFFFYYVYRASSFTANLEIPWSKGWVIPYLGYTVFSSIRRRRHGSKNIFSSTPTKTEST